MTLRPIEYVPGIYNCPHCHVGVHIPKNQGEYAECENCGQQFLKAYFFSRRM